MASLETTKGLSRRDRRRMQQYANTVPTERITYWDNSDKTLLPAIRNVYSQIDMSAPTARPNPVPTDLYDNRESVVQTAPATRKRRSTNGSYKIQKGDTLSAIAQRYGTTVQAIAEANVNDANRDQQAKAAAAKALFENIKVGVMTETASSGVIADMLAEEADFFSIGTNDLTGYTMAADRGNGDVAYLYSPFQPSVIRMIKRIITCASEAGIPVGMCGEAAANPMMIPLLISFGLTEFSVSAPSVLKVRKNIAKWTKSEADAVAAPVLEMTTEAEVVAYLKTAL